MPVRFRPSPGAKGRGRHLDSDRPGGSEGIPLAPPALDTTRPSLLLRIRDPADTGAWELFDAIYRPILHRYARTWSLDFTDAEDVVQHALSAVHQGADRFEYDPQRGSFRGWLRTVANNHIRNMLRGRERELPDHDQAMAEADTLSDEDVFDRVWQQEHLWHCLRELETEVGEQTYRIYYRHVFDEVPAPVLAEEHGVSTGNVHTIKWRLTRRVAERMQFLTREDP